MLSALSGLGTVVKNQLTLGLFLSSSVLSINLSTFPLKLQGLVYRRFRISLEIR